MSQFELHVANGSQKGTVIPLPAGKFMIGREEDCQLRPNSDLVSRHHCVFNVDEFGVRLRDLGSTNGTLVNGERVRAVHVLKHGDIVAVGRLEFRVVDGAQIAEEEADETVASADDLDTMMHDVENIPVADRPTPPPTSVDTSETLTDMPVVGDETKIAAFGSPGPGETGFYYPGPQMPMPYGQPYGYPGYPMPMGGFYPGMGYPPQMYPQYPQQPYPGQPAPQQPQEETTTQTTTSGKNQEVRLPDPSQTGAKPPEPKPEPPKDAKGEVKKNIPDTAAGIIKQYLQRRPTT